MFALSPALLKTFLHSRCFRFGVRRVVCALLLVSVVFHVTAPPLSAATDVPACGFAEIRGVVTAEDTGLPLPDISVTATADSALGSAATDERGIYTITVPFYRDAGPYDLNFSAQFFAVLPSVAYLSANVTNTEVISGETTVVNVTLPRGGAIQGQVRAADTGNPLEGVLLTVYRSNASNFSFADSASTDAEGNFAVYGLEAGSYVVRYDSLNIGSTPETAKYETGYVGRVNYASESTQFVVTEALTTTVNISIPLGTSIVGEIRRSDTNSVVPAVSVHAYLLDESGEGHRDFISASSGSSFGLYSVGPLAPGKYLLFAQTQRTNGSGGAQYHNTWDLEMEWYKDVYRSVDAEVVEVPEIGASAPISVDFMLSPGATITGVVTDADTGEPLPNMRVTTNPSVFTTYDISILFGHDSYQVTDENGVYEIAGLPDGEHFAYAVPSFGSEYGSIGQPLVGVSVTVAGTALYPNVNFSIRRGGDISGTLTDDKGQPVAGIQVTLVTSNTLASITSTTSDALGNYSFRNVAPGDYRVRYDRFDPCGCYNNEYYTGDGVQEDGVVTVEPSKTTTGVDASMECNAPPPANSLYMPRIQP